MDPDAVWDGEWRRRRVLDGVVIVEGEGAVLWVNLGRSIVTTGTFAWLCESVALFPNDLGDDLLALALFKTDDSTLKFWRNCA